jgi:hypothetical protein
MNIYELQDAILAECEALLSPSLTGRSIPARRYVSHGQPPVESCDGLLAVWSSSLETRQIGRSDIDITHRVILLNVDIWRCWPTGDSQPPTLDELTNASLMVCDDVDRLTKGLGVYLAEYCGPVEWRPALPVGPLGGMAGWRITVMVPVD